MMLRQEPAISEGDAKVKSKSGSEWLRTKRDIIDFEMADSCPVASATRISAKAQAQGMFLKSKHSVRCIILLNWHLKVPSIEGVTVL